MKQAGFVVPKFGLDTLGLKNLGNVHWNLSVPALYEEAIRRGEGQIGDGGAFVVRTGVHTGRSPNDKFIVEDSETKDQHRLGQDQPADRAGALPRALQPHAGATPSAASCSCTICCAGADPAHRIGVRVITETAWHSLFARNMFLRPAPRGARGLRARLHHPATCRASRPIPTLDGTALATAPSWSTSPTRVVLIGGTRYAGEIKKSIFTRPELPAARAGRAADALLGQRRPEGRRRDLLRPVRHRQDDAVGRPVAHADRRRRARLERRAASSTSRAAATPR